MAGVSKRELKLEKPACGHCGALTRPKYSAGGGAGKYSRTQHAGWRVCANGHELRVKRT